MFDVCGDDCCVRRQLPHSSTKGEPEQSLLCFLSRRRRWLLVLLRS